MANKTKGTPSSVDNKARLLVTFLLACARDELMSYDAMSEHMGFPITGASPVYQKARRILLRDHDRVFETIKGEGTKWLLDSDVVHESGRMQQAIRRRARRELNRLDTVNVSELTAQQRQEHDLRRTHAVLLRHAATAKAVERLEAAVNTRSNTLELQEALRALTHRRNGEE